MAHPDFARWGMPFLAALVDNVGVWWEQSGHERAAACAQQGRARRIRLDTWNLLATASFVAASVLFLDTATSGSWISPSVAALAFLCTSAFALLALQKLICPSGSGETDEAAGDDGACAAGVELEAVQRLLEARRAQAQVLALLQQQQLRDSAVTPRETAGWLNRLLVRLWPNAIARPAAAWLEAALLRELWYNAPTSLKSVVVEELSLGECAPLISAAEGVCWTDIGDPSSPQEALRAGVEWTSVGAAVRLRMMLGVPSSGGCLELRASITDFRVSGTVRALPILDSCSGLLWAFTQPPAVSFSCTLVDAEGGQVSSGTGASAQSGLDSWLESCVFSLLSAHLVEPHRQLLPLALPLPPTLPISAGGLPDKPLALLVELLTARNFRRSPTEGEPDSSAAAGPVVVELACGGVVRTSGPGAWVSDSRLAWDGRPVLLASGMSGTPGVARVDLSVYELPPFCASGVPTPPAPLILGRASFHVQVLGGVGEGRAAVLWASAATPSGKGEHLVVARIDRLEETCRLVLGVRCPASPELQGIGAGPSRGFVGEIEVAVKLEGAVTQSHGSTEEGWSLGLIAPGSGEPSLAAARGWSRGARVPGGRLMRVTVQEGRGLFGASARTGPPGILNQTFVTVS